MRTKLTHGVVIEAALCQAIGLPKIDAQYDEQILEAAHREFRGRRGPHQTMIMAEVVLLSPDG